MSLHKEKSILTKIVGVCSHRDITCALLYITVFFSPMGANAIYLECALGRLSLFRFFLLLTFLGGMAYIIIYNRPLKLYNQNNRYSVVYFAFWLLYAIISILWSYDLNNYIRTMWFLISGICLIVLINNSFDYHNIVMLFWAFDMGLLVQALIGVCEHVTCNYFFLEKSKSLVYLSKKLYYPIAMMGNTNDMATASYLGAFVTLFILFSTNF